mmetsp:Transcript_5900/g.14105  ORF Transcript_5900/g.14105 Transcript_5900/m.14105 type:complete len:200 (-) Transcript_5900:1317-1916(-)
MDCPRCLAHRLLLDPSLLFQRGISPSLESVHFHLHFHGPCLLDTDTDERVDHDQRKLVAHVVGTPKKYRTGLVRLLSLSSFGNRRSGESLRSPPFASDLGVYATHRSSEYIQTNDAPAVSNNHERLLERKHKLSAETTVSFLDDHGVRGMDPTSGERVETTSVVVFSVEARDTIRKTTHPNRRTTETTAGTGTGTSTST